MESKSLEDHKRRTFDSYCKKVLKNEARDYYKGASRRRKREVSLDELSYQESQQLYVIDTYFAMEHIITVLGYDVVVTDEVLAQALTRLPPLKRSIILLSYFLDMPDREIGEMLHMIRASVQYHRSQTLKELKEIIEEEKDEL